MDMNVWMDELMTTNDIVMVVQVLVCGRKECVGE
jgi:hypothetical protein